MSSLTNVCFQTIFRDMDTSSQFELLNKLIDILNEPKRKVKVLLNHNSNTIIFSRLAAEIIIKYKGDECDPELDVTEGVIKRDDPLLIKIAEKLGDEINEQDREDPSDLRIVELELGAAQKFEIHHDENGVEMIDIIPSLIPKSFAFPSEQIESVIVTMCKEPIHIFDCVMRDLADACEKRCIYFHRSDFASAWGDVGLMAQIKNNQEHICDGYVCIERINNVEHLLKSGKTRITITFIYGSCDEDLFPSQRILLDFKRCTAEINCMKCVREINNNMLEYVIDLKDIPEWYPRQK